MGDTQSLERKFRLTPEAIEPKTWLYYLESQIRKEEYKKKKLDETKDAEKIAKIDKNIEKYKADIEETNRKMKAKEPFDFTKQQISNAIYTYLRDCAYNQNKAMNICMTNLGTRLDQKTFECSDPKCSSHKKNKAVFTADKNAARNIAKSTLYDEKTHSTQGEVETMKKTAQKYYNITFDDFVDELGA